MPSGNTDKLKACTDGIVAKMGEAPEPYTFDFGILIPLVLDILVEQLAGCFAKSATPETVMQKLADRNFMARWEVRKAISRASRDEGAGLRHRELQRVEADMIAWATQNRTDALAAMDDVASHAADFGDLGSVF